MESTSFHDGLDSVVCTTIILHTVVYCTRLLGLSLFSSPYKDSN